MENIKEIREVVESLANSGKWNIPVELIMGQIEDKIIITKYFMGGDNQKPIYDLDSIREDFEVEIKKLKEHNKE